MAFRYSIYAMIWCVILSLFSPVPIHAEPFIWAPPELDHMIRHAISSNKEIKSMAFKLESLKKKVRAAGALPDPKLGLAVLNLPVNSFHFDEQAMTQKQISVAQRIPWHGKLGLNVEKTKNDVLKYETFLYSEKIALSRDIAVAYYDMGIIKISQEINEKMTEMVKQISKVAETRYTTGRGFQQDIFQAQVELSTLMDEKIVLDRQYYVKMLNLSALMSSQEFLKITPVTDLDAPDFNLTPKDLKATALLWNPQLKIKRLEAEDAQIMVAMAGKDFYPDIDVMLAYGQREEDLSGNDLDDFFSASVIIPVPLWQHRKQKSNHAAAEEKHQGATQELAYLRDTIFFKIDAMVGEIEDLKKNYHLYRDQLLIQAEQWARSALSGYEVGKIEFNTMINARIRLLRFELQARKYLFNIYQKRAELEAIVGKPLGELTENT